MGDTGVILAAAGQGRRMQANANKVFLPLMGRPILCWSLDLFENLPEVAEIVVAAHPDEMEYVEKEIIRTGKYKKVKAVVPGGKERQDSVRAALSAFSGNLRLVAVHDGARPLLSRAMASRVIERARESGAACPGVAAKDTLKTSGGEWFESTLDRSKIFQVQTPQVFELAALREAYDAAYQESFYATDDTAVYERYRGPVSLVVGEYRNIKITTQEDMDIAAGLLGGRNTMRIGTGYDVHRLVEERDLVIGGVKIPWEKGLLGHSDADVLLHAICDALLGAAALGDIGHHFPDSDARYKGISSMVLLAETGRLISSEGYILENLDATVIAERPKLAPYINEMRAKIAGALGTEDSRISIKATTTEGLGFAGRGEGIAAQASALLRSIHG